MGRAKVHQSSIEDLCYCVEWRQTPVLGNSWERRQVGGRYKCQNPMYDLKMEALGAFQILFA
jgi:hypothetical protein